MLGQESQMIARLVGNLAGIKIEEGARWSVDTAKKIIYYPKNAQTTWNDEFTPQALGFLLHESAHIKYTKGQRDLDKTAKRKNKNASKIFELLNSLEDIRVNGKIIKHYPGARSYIENSQYPILDKIAQHSREIEEYAQFCLFPQYSEYVNPTGQAMKLFFAGLSPKVLALLTPEMLKHFETATKKNSTRKLWAYIKKHILDDFLTLLEDDKPQDEKKKKQATRAVSDALNKSAEEVQGESEGIMRPMNKEGKKLARAKNPGQAPATVRPNKKIARDDKGVTAKIINTARPLYTQTARALSVLKDRETTREEYRQKSGKIDLKRLPKLFATPPGNNPRLFKRTTLTQKTEKIVCAFLIDISGSMLQGTTTDLDGVEDITNSRAFNAGVAVETLATALTRGGKEFGIFGFNNGLEIFKPFGATYYPAQVGQVIANTNGGTSLFTPLARVLELTKQEHPNKKPFIFVLSDGHTNDEGGRDENNRYRSDTIESTQALAKKLGAEIIPIQLDSNGLEQYYKHVYNVNKPEELPKLFAKIFNKIIGTRRV